MRFCPKPGNQKLKTNIPQTQINFLSTYWQYNCDADFADMLPNVTHFRVGKVVGSLTSTNLMTDTGAS
jgi:hypothetical protein